jgi:HPt (histidine-containing phosphotransfer) domain-containing protein
MDFTLKISFLQQFSRQAETLAGQGEGVLSKFLDVSRTLSARSGEDAKGFFDQVDELLARTESALHGGVDAFLQEMKGQLGLGEEELAGMGELMHQGIADFFAEAADFLDQAEAQLAAPDLPAPEVEAALAA